MATITAAAGGGNWTVGATWVGGVAPTSADDAVLDATSGNVTIDSGAVCRSVNCTGYTATLTHNTNVTLTIGDGTAGAGNVALLFVSGMTYVKGSVTTSAVSFVSTSATTQTITSGGKLFGNVTFNGAGSSYQLTDTHNLAATTAAVTLTAGTLDTNGQICIWGVFSSSNSNTRTLTLGSSSVTLSGTGTVWDFTTATNLTFNANTSSITFTGASAILSGGAKTFNTVVFTGSGSASIGSGGATFANLTRTGTAARTDSLLFGQTNYTITGTLTLTGNSAINRLLVSSSVIGTPRTITVGTLVASRVDFRDITAAGAADWNISAILGGSGDCGGNTGITFTAPQTQYWFQNTGNWSDASKWFQATNGGGGAGRVPLSQDPVVFDANSFSTSGQTVSADMPRMGYDMTWTGATNSPTLSATTVTVTIFGSATFISGMTLSGNQFFVLENRTAKTLTSVGRSFPAGLNIQSAGGSTTLQDDLTVVGTLQLIVGTLVATTQNVQCTSFNGNNNNTKTLTMGSGVWTATGTGDVWRLAPGATTLNAGTSTIILSNTSSSTKTFNGATNFTIAPYYRISISGGGSGTVSFGGALTANTIDIGAPKSVIFASSNTITVTNFNAVGTPGNLVTITSSTNGSPATLSKASGVVACDYLSLKDSTATGGATWYAGVNSTNVSGNTGWLFSSAPPRSVSTQSMMGV